MASTLWHGASTSTSHFQFSTRTHTIHNPKPLETLKFKNFRFPSLKTSSTTDENAQFSSTHSLLTREPKSPNKEVEECVQVLKNAAKTRKVEHKEILSAFSALEKAKLDPSSFFETLGGTSSPGKTWMLVFTADKGLDSGKFFPITAVQRFDAAGKRIENGVYFGSLGALTFEGRISWKKRILAFVFERVRVKIGPFDPIDIGLGGDGNREPGNKDPFFIWFYVDEEIAVARGKSGGTAFWVRCKRINGY